MDKATRKALTNISLIWGLAAEIEDSYKAKEPRDLCQKIKKQADKCFDLWPIPEDDNPKNKILLVKKTEVKLLKLQKDLSETNRLTFIACGLIVLDEMVEKLRHEKEKEIEKLRLLVLDLIFYIDRGAKDNYLKYRCSEEVMSWWEV